MGFCDAPSLSLPLSLSLSLYLSLSLILFSRNIISPIQTLHHKKHTCFSFSVQSTLKEHATLGIISHIRCEQQLYSLSRYNSVIYVKL